MEKQTKKIFVEIHEEKDGLTIIGDYGQYLASYALIGSRIAKARVESGEPYEQVMNSLKDILEDAYEAYDVLKIIEGD